MLIECLQTEKEFKALKEEWNHILSNSNSNNIFLAWEWMFTWWKYYSYEKKLFIVAVRDKEGRLLGLAPLCIKKFKIYGIVPIRTLTFLGTEEVCSDYLDFIIYTERNKEVLKAILKYIEAHSKMWDYVLLSDMQESASNFNNIKEILDSKDADYLISEAEVCPYLKLPESYEVYIQGLSKNMRYNLKRRTKNLEKRYNATFSILNGSSNLENAMESLFELHRKRRGMIGSEGDFLKENLKTFHKEIANLFNKKDILRIYYMSIKRKVVSILYGFRYNDKFFYYQFGMDPDYDKQSVGLVLMGHCIRDSIANKLEEYDFLRGRESYKYKWTHTYKKTFNITIVSDSFKSRSYITIKSILHKVKGIVKRRHL